MSEARWSALRSLWNSGLEVEFLREDDLGKYISEGDLHPAYTCLSSVHKSDYLRCLFMHRFGGGYSDIKWIHDSWQPIARRLESDEHLLGAGYSERRPDYVANIHRCEQLLEHAYARRLFAYLRYRYRYLCRRYTRLIGNCAFLFKPGSQFTSIWWKQINARLDHLHAYLKTSPARSPRDASEHAAEGGASDYPVPWVYLAGAIVHPLSYRFRHRLSHDLPVLKFNTDEYSSYR